MAALDTLIELIKELLSHVWPWLTWIKFAELIMPIVVSVIATLYLKSQFTKSVNELKKELNEAVGGFRVAARGITASTAASLARTVKKTGATFKAEVSEQMLLMKQQLSEDFAQQIEQEVEAESSDVVDDEAADKAWGELSEMWSQVSDYIQALKTEALPEEKGKRRAKLENTDARKPRELILVMYQLGWLSDDQTDLALELAIIHSQHKNRRVPVAPAGLQKARNIYDKFLDAVDNELRAARG